MLSRRDAILIAPLVALVAACRRKNTGLLPGQALSASDPVDTGFEGCTGWGKKPAAGQAVILQPAAREGDATRCLVSGVAFVIEPKTPAKHVGDTAYYFCCAACLQYFASHQRDVLAKRGLRIA